MLSICELVDSKYQASKGYHDYLVALAGILQEESEFETAKTMYKNIISLSNSEAHISRATLELGNLCFNQDKDLNAYTQFTKDVIQHPLPIQSSRYFNIKRAAIFPSG